MKRIKMTKATNDKTFEEGFEEFLFDCKSRNLREDTLEHYRQGYKPIYCSYYVIGHLSVR